MDLEKAGLVICLTLFIVIGVNAAIYAALRRNKTAGQIELMRRAANRAKNPWEEEDQALQELSRRVKQLQNTQSDKKEPGKKKSE
jgi:hypothetical protein